MKLSVIIPVFNEEKTLMEVINTIRSVDVDKEIIIVDDASTDSSHSILDELSRKQNIKVLFHDRNTGKGGAIKTAMAHIKGDLVIIQDADLEYNPRQYPALMKPIIEGRADVVYGSRFMKYNKRIYLRFYLGNKLLSLFISLLFMKHITDSYTCYKLFKKEVFKNLNITSNGFEMEAEITAKVLKKKYRLLEVPIDYNPRSIKEGKKICWKDAVVGMFSILKYRLKRIK